MEGRVRCACIKVWVPRDMAHVLFKRRILASCICPLAYTPPSYTAPHAPRCSSWRSFCVQPFLTRNTHTPTNTHVTPHTSPFEDRGYTSLALNKNLSLTYLTSQVHPVHHPHIAHALLDHESESQKEAATAGVYHAHRPLFFFCSCSSYLYHSRTHLLTHSSPSAAQISRSAAFIWLAFR